MVLICVLAIMIAAILANHMGLVSAIEKTISRELPVVNCVRCLTFWATTIWLALTLEKPCLPIVIATALIAAYIATWLELAFGLLNKLYEKVYNKIFPEEQGDDAEEKSASAKDTEHKTSDL